MTINVGTIYIFISLKMIVLAPFVYYRRVTARGGLFDLLVLLSSLCPSSDGRQSADSPSPPSLSPSVPSLRTAYQSKPFNHLFACVFLVCLTVVFHV